MTDRDYFAAAALSGLLDKNDAGKDIAAWWPEMACNAAYRWADAMLRERERTNHDAAPATRATKGGDTPAPDAVGTGKYIGPVAWAVCDATWYHDVRLSQWTAEAHAAKLNAARAANVYRAVPLYRQPQPTLTDAEREAIVAAIRSWPAIGVTRENVETLRCLLARLS
jgi:hypothetical protein